MAKKTKKSNKSLLNTLLVVLGISLFLFGVVVFKNNQENSDVKGDSTALISEVQMVQVDAGEACGRSISRRCKNDLVCAPLAPSYRLLNAKASEVESTTESESVSTDAQKCLGMPENEIKGGCAFYIPYYGACVKKGVWPPPSITPKPTSGPCIKPPEPCKETDKSKCPKYSPPAPGTIICTPTPSSCYCPDGAACPKQDVGLCPEKVPSTPPGQETSVSPIQNVINSILKVFRLRNQ